MKQRPPADLQPELWTILALANHVADEPASLPAKQPQNEPDQPCLADKPVSLPEQQPDAALATRDLAAAALAYLAKLGRPPAAAVQLTAAARRYLNGPLVVGSHSWGDMIPAWLRDAIQVARLGLVMASETELASEEEAVAYLMAASLEAPLAHEWAERYFWLCAPTRAGGGCHRAWPRSQPPGPGRSASARGRRARSTAQPTRGPAAPPDWPP